MDKEAVFSSALAFANYISEYHNRAKGKAISPIKLQKSLYFCFAYWGAYIEKAKLSSFETDVAEVDFTVYPAYLFPDNINDYFEAWTYGPVIRSVYQAQAEIIRDPVCDEAASLRPEVFEMIDGLLNQLFDISDFSLVNISHSDDVWKQNYDVSADSHNKVIAHDAIIEEYMKKHS
jgi:uncharacterized phage-associated protein